MTTTKANEPIPYGIVYHEPTCFSLVTGESLDCHCLVIRIVLTDEQGHRSALMKSRSDRRKSEREAEKAIRKMRTNGR